MEVHKITTGKKLYEQVLDRIKGGIAQGIYQKGDLLPSEKDLMEQMGVSRITVREALRLLAEAGIIETRRGKGSFVRIDSASLLQNTAAGKECCKAFLNSTNARLLLEPSVAAHVAEYASEQDLKKLELCFSPGRSKSDFHRTLIELTQNPVLMQWFDQSVQLETGPTIEIVPPARQQSAAAVLEAQHRKVYEAIRDKKPDCAFIYMKEHMEYVRNLYEEYFSIFFEK